MEKRTLTAPLGVIKVMDREGVLHIVGKLRNIRVSETFRRLEIKELGTPYPQELPFVDWTGSFNAGRYFVDLKHRTMNAPNRGTSDPESFANTLLLKERGFIISLYKKSDNPDLGYQESDTGFVTEVGLEHVITINQAFIEGDNIDLSIGQAAGNDQQFRYLRPVLAVQ